jgi:septal ring factor EnvC (AmiA/AmiB activator)
MADDPTNGPKTAQSKTRESLEKQVSHLRREIAKINKTLIDRAEDVAEQANVSASERASKAAKALRTQAQSVSEVVRENPGTLSSAVIVGVLIGFAVGFVVGESQASDSRRRWY